jgi:ribosome recycling factor
MAEEAKVAVRAVRRDGIDEAKTKQKNSEITEDELKNAENDIQKLTDKKIEEVDKILENKEKEIMSV